MQKTFLSTVFFMLVSVATFAQEVYTQDFENGLPDDWTITGEWQYTNSTDIASSYFQPPEHTNFMGVNDDALGTNVSGSGTVTTGPIDLTDATSSLVLNFESFFPDGGSFIITEEAIVHISTDEGAIWTELINLGEEDKSGFGWRSVSVSLTEYIGQTIWLQFEYSDGGEWNFGWCFDDITIVPQGLTNIKNTYRNDLAKVYPNPTSYNATMELNLETSSDVLVEAFNTVGQRVAITNYGTLVGTNVLSFDSSNLANGIYTIHIHLDNANVIKKITVQK